MVHGSVVENEANLRAACLHGCQPEPWRRPAGGAGRGHGGTRRCRRSPRCSARCPSRLWVRGVAACKIQCRAVRARIPIIVFDAKIMLKSIKLTDFFYYTEFGHKSTSASWTCTPLAASILVEVPLLSMVQATTARVQALARIRLASVSHASMEHRVLPSIASYIRSATLISDFHTRPTPSLQLFTARIQ